MRSLRTIRFLVVDDCPIQRRLIVSTLRAFGARSVREASSGLSAVAQISDAAPDVVLLDWLMPDMSGRDVLQALAEGVAPSNPAAIVMTVSPTLSAVTTARDLGAANVIRKPFAPVVLLKALKRIEDTRAAAPPVEAEALLIGA